MRSGSETASTPASTVTDLHLTMTGRVYPRTMDGCEECLELGTEWVHSRLCLTCGHVGCCDTSPHRHARAHAHAAGHAIARSFEPGEGWQWDSWVLLEGSPLLAHDTPRTVDQAESLHREAALGNLFVKIPGTAEGLSAIEECIYAGVPANMPLLFSAEQHAAAARAYQRGVQRRIRAGLNPAAGSVASLFPARWARLANGEDRPQRLLWAPTSVKDPRARDVLYVEALAAPFTVDTMPDQTLEAFAASWLDLLALISARHEQLARTV